ncbi:MAG: DUF6580 family putative transport protein [Christensenellaceae bacterium]|jgi:energy-coupling factor transport system substrate-specific component
MRNTLKIIEPAVLVAVPAVLVLCALFKTDYAALLSAAVVVLSLLPFFFRYELEKPRPRDMMPIVVLTAIAVIGRIAFGPIQNFQPVTAIVIVAGLYFGKQNGFLAGAFAALASNMFFGQGAWTPWQMYAWGLAGYLAGSLRQTVLFKSKLGIYIYGAAVSLLFGAVMDSYFLIGFVQQVTPASVAAAYLAGLPLNLAHAASTVIFLVLVLVPWGKKIDRIKQKYELSDSR